ALAKHDLPGNWRDLKRLAANLVVALTPDERGRTDADLVLDRFERPPSVVASAPRVSPTKRAFLRQLEEKLGEGLEKLWALREAHANAHTALRALGFSKDTARLAENLIREGDYAQARGWLRPARAAATTKRR